MRALRIIYILTIVLGGAVIGFLIGWRLDSHEGGISLPAGYRIAFFGLGIGFAVGGVIAVVVVRTWKVPRGSGSHE